MRIDHTHKKWFIASVALLALAGAAYAWSAWSSPHGPKGGSALGLTFGIVGSAFMLFAGLLAPRKKVPVWRAGRAQTWMRGHLWLGLLSLPLILFHGGFHFGGTLSTVLMVLLIFVTASGVFGAALQHYLPELMTREVPLETIFEEIDHVRAQLRAEADQIASAACGSLGLAAGPEEPTDTSDSRLAGGTTAYKQPTAAASVAVLAVTEEECAPLRSFYLREMRPFLENPGARSHPLGDAAQARSVFQELRRRLPPAAHDALKDLEDICEEERQLNRQARLHYWLHGWLLLHVPLSLALLLLGAVHAAMALRY
ncbi:MAG: hypothetical protein HY237_10360 [Acidobacteria bacterium]|nr:hypothetical protein [Acidobacteriota bacterium]